MFGCVLYCALNLAEAYEICNQKCINSAFFFVIGLLKQTVNLLAYAYEGSNPSPTTNPFHRMEIHFQPMFTGLSTLIKVFVHVASMVLLSFA